MSEQAAQTAPTVMLVEDDQNLMHLMKRILRMKGLDAHTAADAESALALLSEAPEINILITDYLLSGDMNGVDLVSEARRQFPRLRCVVISGDVQKVHAYGLPIGTELLQKPFSVQQFIELVS
ncbi:MAG: response regulator [Pseudomonadota bacterium]